MNWIGWWLIKRHRVWMRTTAVFIATVFLYTSLAAPIVEANFWDQRRKTVEQKIKSPEQTTLDQEMSPLVGERRSPETSPLYASAVPLEGRASDWFNTAEPSLQIPAGEGTVTKVFRGSPDKPLIIHMQDAHGHYNAQKHASNILQHLQTQQRAQWIGIEGAWDVVPVDWLAAFPDKEVKTEVVKEYFNRGELNGEEYLALNQAPGSWELFGIENQVLYQQNINARDDSAPSRAQAEHYFQDLQSRLARLKNKLYPPTLREFERFYQSYHNQQISFVPYVKRLIHLSPSLSADRSATLSQKLSRFQLLARTLSLTEREKTISQQAVERERDELLRSLTDTLPKNELNQFLEQALRFRLGTISPRQFHELLLAKATQLKKPIPALKDYTAYLREFESIDQEKIEEDIGRLEKFVWNELCSNDTVRQLGTISRWVTLQEKLWSLRLNPDESKEYISWKENVRWSDVVQFIQTTEGKAGLMASAQGAP
ncbi:MAG TPA: hypothetical protein PK876_11070, partial [Elusimicrobiota bacterium]|nr:hypothetical protein [Elusimicrobiota bacterium]